MTETKYQPLTHHTALPFGKTFRCNCGAILKTRKDADEHEASKGGEK
jgi:hypothetical protein